jgi:hypothetical protein
VLWIWILSDQFLVGCERLGLDPDPDLGLYK